MTLSFLEGRTLTTPPKHAKAFTNPLTEAKAKVVKALQVQRGNAQMLLDGQSLPATDGKKSVSTWFYQEMDGSFGTVIRYGQVAIPLDDTHTSVLIGTLPELMTFYDEVATAIGKGEMDSQIRTLHQSRSAALTGKTRTTREAA